MRVEVYAHEDASTDTEAAVGRCLAYCDRNGWKRPHPMVTRKNDPLSPDLGSVLMADKLGALVVPSGRDLLLAGLDFAVLKAGRRLKLAERRIGALVEAREATRRLIERGALLCFADEDVRMNGESAERLVELLDSFVGPFQKWGEEERREQSEKGREIVEKARAQGKRIGRPPKDRKDERP